MGRVEDGICIFLIWEDVAVFPAAHALPPHYGVFRNDAAHPVVAYHAAEHPVVRCGNVVVLVYGQGGECRGIYTEYLGAVHSRYHGRVEGVDAFHDEDVLFMELHHVAVEISLSFLEVETGNLDLFSVQKVVELFSEEFKVHGLECLEVVFPVCITRGQMSVYEIVVQLYHFRIESEYPALDGESLGGGGLSAA